MTSVDEIIRKNLEEFAQDFKMCEHDNYESRLGVVSQAYEFIRTIIKEDDMRRHYIAHFNGLIGGK